MPTPSHLNKRFKAQRIFTDRDEPKKVFAEALAKPQASDEYRILNFYGMGGLGKTALCEQFTLFLQQQKQQRKAALGWAKLDFQLPHSRYASEALLSIRLQLAQSCSVRFPAFDTAFARYFSFTRPGQDIHDVHPALFKQPNDILQDIESVAGDLIEEVPGVGLIYKYATKLKSEIQRWWQCRGKAILKDLDVLEQHKLLEALPTYLGADSYDWLFEEAVSQPRRLVILIDTYEALWHDQPTKTGADAMRVDAWIRKLAQETPGVLFVLLGRDQLDWGDDWRSVLETHLLGGLLEQDADKFLQHVPIEEAPVREAIIRGSAGIPFYLDLQVDDYETLKQTGTVIQAHLFGGTEQDILSRFTDHLDKHSRRAQQIVSHARLIDEKLVQQLAEHFLGGKASINFKQLTSYSFWKHNANTWIMHGLMRDYLQTQQRADEPELYQQIHQFLFDDYNQQLNTIEHAADIQQHHHQAFAEAGYHLLQWDKTQLPGWANRRGQVFYTACAWELIEPLWDQALQIAQEIGDKSGEGTTLNNLSQIYDARGDYDTALEYLKQSLAIQKEIGDTAGLCITLLNMGHIYWQNEQQAEAKQTWLTVYKMAKPMQLAQVLDALEGLAEQIGLEGGLAGWDELARDS